MPRTLAFCDDLAVNDAPFYVMEKVDGQILRTPAEMAAIAPDDARRCSEALVDVLVEIHAVDYDAVGLDDFGHPDGYLERQVRRWGEQWERSKTRELPAVDELARRLRAGLPESPAPTIVHGDYRLDNTMLAPDDPGTIVAVLDWEMATLGDPLADMGLFLVYWKRDEGAAQSVGAPIDSRAGFLTRDEIIDRYAKNSGPRRQSARLLRGARVVQARDHPRRHPRAVLDGQDARRRLRVHRHDGRGDGHGRARAGVELVDPRAPRLNQPVFEGDN